MIRQIRPYEVFTLIDATRAERVAHVKIPHRRDLKMLETMLLISVAQLLKARRFFDFGTFLGSTTYNLAMNAPVDAEVFTLDLGPGDASEVEQHPLDAPLTGMHLEASAMDFAGTPMAGKIHQLAGNSIGFDFSPWASSIDLSFIDGGHDVRTAEADTRQVVSRGALLAAINKQQAPVP